ncbi:MAG: LCP family protein [Patescibacteria group bacterium]
MTDLKIDLSKIKDELNKEKIINQVPKTRVKKIIFYLVVFLIIIGSSLGLQNVFSTKDNGNDNVGIWTQIKHLLISKDKTLAGEQDDRINFLLLGMGGPGHDGPYLTDTIILASFQPSTKKVALISIPRDMVVPIPGHGWQRINSINSYGESQEAGSGGKFAKDTIEQVLQIPIHYYVRADFTGFSDFINQLGGIKVCVDNGFTDQEYPAANYLYQTVSFEQGCQKMDGDTALKFVRSRHGNNGEGSDFARGERQRKVIMAVKDKIFSLNTLLNPIAIKGLIDQFNEHISTNLEIGQMLKLAQLGQGLTQDNITNAGLTDGPNGLLEVLIGEDGAFLLQPKGGNFDSVRELVKNIFGQPTTADSQKQAAEETKQIKEEEKIIKKENAKIEVRNGTMITGLAAKSQNYLISLGYDVPSIGNAPFRDYEKSVVYDLSSGQFPKTMEFIIDKLEANVSSQIPSWLTTVAKGDIVIILGQEAEKLNL